MSLKQYLLLMSLGTLLCWLSWFFVIFKTNPLHGGLGSLFAFYLSLFLAIIGTFSVLGFQVRKVILKDDEVVFKHVRHTFRQSIFVSTTIIGILILLAHNWLFWWNAAILIIFFVFVESVFFTTSTENRGTIN